MADVYQLLLEARAAVERDDRASARRLLVKAVQADPRNETAWLWLSAVVDDTGREREYLERVLAINPDNATARKHLDRLLATGVVPVSVPQDTLQPVAEPVLSPPAPVPEPQPAPDSQERPWYRSTAVLVAAFVLATPIWSALILTDRRQSRVVKIVAALVAVLYVLLCGGGMLLALSAVVGY
jgi:hypothetical protein